MPDTFQMASVKHWVKLDLLACRPRVLFSKPSQLTDVSWRILCTCDGSPSGACIDYSSALGLAEASSAIKQPHDQPLSSRTSCMLVYQLKSALLFPCLARLAPFMQCDFKPDPIVMVCGPIMSQSQFISALTNTYSIHAKRCSIQATSHHDCCP